MRSLYALRFNVLPTQEHSMEDTVLALQDAVVNWIADWCFQRNHKFRPSNVVGEFIPEENQRFVIALDTLPDQRISIWSMNWSYPHDLDPRILWHVFCEIANTSSEIEFELIIRLESREFIVAPQSFTFNRPKVIPVIINAFHCEINGRRLTTRPNILRVADIPSFVSDTLKSSERRLPVVLFSTETYTEKPIVDPVETASRLVGLAEIFILSDRWASFELTHHIGKTLSCYNGAVRIYYPGFSESSGFKEAPVYLPGQLIFENDGVFAGKLLRLFASMSTVSFKPGRISIEAKDTIRQFQISVLNQKEKDYEKLRQDALDKKDIEELYQITDSELATLRQENASLLFRIEELENALTIANANLQAFWEQQEEGEQPSDMSVPESDEKEVSTLVEAVEKASSLFQNTLVMLPEVKKSAADSPYKQPEKLFRAFDAMDEVCKARRKALKDRESLGPLEKVFNDRGFDYCAHISQTSRGKFGNEYAVKYEGQFVSIEEHLKLGSGGPDTCLRIHFFWDEEKQQFVIAHAGRHKTNTKT